MTVFYIITSVYLPEIIQESRIKICFEDDSQTVSFNLSGTLATAIFRPYNGSLRYLFFPCKNSPGPILDELFSVFNIQVLAEGDFLSYFETDGPFDDYLEKKMNEYFIYLKDFML